MSLRSKLRLFDSDLSACGLLVEFIQCILLWMRERGCGAPPWYNFLIMGLIIILRRIDPQPLEMCGFESDLPLRRTSQTSLIFL